MNIHNKCTGYSSSGELLFDSFYFPVSWLWKIFLSFTVFQQDLFLPFIVNSFSLQLLVHQFLGAKNVPKKAISNALDEPIFATSLDTVCTHEVSFGLSMCPSKICSTILLRILLPYVYLISVISQPILFEFWFIIPIIGLAFSLGTTVPDQS